MLHLTLLSLTLASAPGQTRAGKDLAPAGLPPLTTIAEASGWRRTGRYDEVLRLCRAFEAAHPGRAACRTFGTTPEGREMVALVVADGGALDPETARAAGRPVVLFQGGIHAGEIDGKDAGFWLLRDLLAGKTLPQVLSQLTAVFVPVFNVDGHERFGANNRPNQRGPEEMGWRTTSQNLNLNRDYAKAETPEMAAMIGLLRKWDPIAYLDLHVTDGSDFQPDIAILVDPSLAGPEPLKGLGVSFRENLVAGLRTAGHQPLDFYPSFEKDDDPSSGFGVGIGPPRFSTGYWGARNRFGVLVETHSWKSYATRVKATRAALEATLRLAARDGRAWMAAAKEVDRATQAVGDTDVVVRWEASEKATTIEFPGYAYVREPSAVSGRMMIRYDPSKPQVWKIPFFGELVPKTTVHAPKGGYVIPPAQAGWLGERLALHGVTFRRLSAEQPARAVEVFRAASVEFGKAPYEGRMTATPKGAWTSDTRPLLAGSLYVPISQPLGRLILHLLEPTAPDSFVAWGFFNGSFERKEYMEPYVAEQVAREMLAKDRELAAEFHHLLDSDAAFAASPEQRLEFFYRRHPSWDRRMNEYPVLRVSAEP